MDGQELQLLVAKKQLRVHQISRAIYVVLVDFPRFCRHLALFAPDLFKRFRAHPI